MSEWGIWGQAEQSIWHPWVLGHEVLGAHKVYFSLANHQEDQQRRAGKGGSCLTEGWAVVVMTWLPLASVNS